MKKTHLKYCSSVSGLSRDENSSNKLLEFVNEQKWKKKASRTLGVGQRITRGVAVR